MTVAGFVFDKPRARKISRKWKAILNEPQYGLEMFHMVDCANGAPPYDVLGRPKCDRLARRLIQQIREHMDCEFAFSVKVDDFINVARIVSQETGIDWLTGYGGPYTYLTQECLAWVGRWCREAAPRELVTYYFEQGNAFQSEANHFLNLLTSEPSLSEWANRYHYYTHMFLPKRDTRPLQAADILAWEWMRDRTEQLERVPIRPRRLSLSYLLHRRINHVVHFREPDLLTSFRLTAAHERTLQRSGTWKSYAPTELEKSADKIRQRLWGDAIVA